MSTQNPQAQGPRPSPPPRSRIPSKTFEANLGHLLRGSDLSRDELAAEIGLKNSRTLDRYEKGETQPKLQTLVALASHFGLSLEALVSEDLTGREVPKTRVPMTSVVGPGQTHGRRALARSSAEFSGYSPRGAEEEAELYGFAESRRRALEILAKRER